MRDIRLNTSKDVISFLKILAEESVKSAQQILDDPAQEAIKKQMRHDKEVFSTISEQPEEEVSDSETATADVEVQAPPTPDKEDPEHLEVSLDSITDSIKQLRSGRSVDDSRIRDEMRTYYDRIDDSERQALLAFMRAFSGILTGTLTGADAPDPSAPPYSVSISSDSNDREEVSVDVEKSEVDVEDVPDMPPEEEEEEDTSPPVRVGGPQSLEEVRKKIRKLMRK